MLDPDRADALAAVQARAYAGPGMRAWLGKDFVDMAESAAIRLLLDDGEEGCLRGFALLSVVADEAELLALAVDPARQGRGVGRGLVEVAVARCREEGATRMILEVAETNHAAVEFYRALRFLTISRRKEYYRLANGRVDALMMERIIGPSIPSATLAKS